MKTINIEFLLAESKVGSYGPSEFSVHLDRTECDTLYAIRAGLIETDSPVMSRPAVTAGGPELIRWLLRRVAGVSEKPIPEPPPEPVLKPPVAEGDEPADEGTEDGPTPNKVE